MPNLNATGFEHPFIDVTSSCPTQVQNSPIIPITWTVTYTGGESDIYEVASYISESGAHVEFYHGGYHVMGDSTTIRSTQFDMRTVPPGSYAIEVRSYTPDNTASTSQPCGSYQWNTKGVTFIKLN